VQSNRRGFTLIELLIVVAVIGILAGMLLGALGSAKTRTDIAVARSQLNAISAALAMYEQDQGRYPRLSDRTGTAPYLDDCPALYMGLMNRSTLSLGGGANAPYLENWKPESIGLLNTGMLDPAAGTRMGSDASAPDWTGINLLDPNDYAKVKTPGYQTTYRNGGGSSQRLVLLDPWGNPFHYREWASLRQSFKDTAIMTPQDRGGTMKAAPSTYAQGQPPVSDATSGATQAVNDLPHNPESFDMWSNGPNGINEFGHPDSDDVTNWSDSR
jgi:prepilin-type N-terminal cleavage/methylation domain-containing protein